MALVSGQRSKRRAGATGGDLDSLLCPKSVAVIGASRSPGKVGHEILSNILNGGFEGQVLPVNPSVEEILGVKCVDHLSAFSEADRARVGEYWLKWVVS